MGNGNELEGMKAALVVPTYGSTNPKCARTIRVAMMSAANHGLKWAGDISPDRMGWGQARNTAAQNFIMQGPGFADGILWIDDDMVIPSDAISRLLDQVNTLPCDFISGLYHQRAGDHLPVFYHFNKNKGHFSIFKEYPENVIVPIEGCGFGFVWTSAKLIEAVARHPDFDSKKGWFPDERYSGGFGEDLSFCHMATKCDIQLYVDTGIQLGHMGDPDPIVRENYLAKKAAKPEGEVRTQDDGPMFGLRGDK
jgi:hypothetical protein